MVEETYEQSKYPQHQAIPHLGPGVYGQRVAQGLPFMTLKSDQKTQNAQKVGTPMKQHIFMHFKIGKAFLFYSIG